MRRSRRRPLGQLAHAAHPLVLERVVVRLDRDVQAEHRVATEQQLYLIEIGAGADSTRLPEHLAFLRRLSDERQLLAAGPYQRNRMYLVGGTLEPESSVATMIDVMVVEPERQAETLRFDIANSRAFAEEPGFRSTSILRGRNGTRIATYSQWDRAEDWIAAVISRAGQSIPELRQAETISDVKAALEESGRRIGAVPEYDAYRVISVATPTTEAR